MLLGVGGARGARRSRTGSGMPHFTLDLRDEFRAGVVDPWLADHAAGLTPNPCVRCNGHVRLDAMLAFADRLGAAALATGHYARIDADGRLRAGADPAKDQAYMLAATAPETLARLRFPLGELTKTAGARARRARPACRSRARPSPRTCASWPAWARRRFLAKHGGARRARATSSRDGAVVGRHAGAAAASPSGSARGIGVAAEEPLYVLGKARRHRGRGRARATSWPRARWPSATPSCTRARRSTRSGCATAPRSVPRAASRAELRARARRAGRRRRAGPGRRALRGDAVVGHGTIA